MGRKIRITVDVTELGKKGGLARAANLTPEERKESARSAVAARWEQYYRDNPAKLKAREEREARKTGKPGRPPRKDAPDEGKRQRR